MRRQPTLERRFCAICEEPYSTAPSDPFNTCSSACEETQMAEMRAKMIAGAAPVATSMCAPVNDAIMTPLDEEYFFQ